MRLRTLALAAALLLARTAVHAQAPVVAGPLSVIIDTDIGDDVDDVYALGLALTSPELKVLGITAAWGDTALRAQMIDRLLCETGRTEIPVFKGVDTTSKTAFTQAPWAKAGIARPYKDGVAFLLEQIKQHPGQITLIALGPLTNIGAAIDRDATTFGKLKSVVLMGGSVYHGYGAADAKPQPEYNIASDAKGAQKLVATGVPLYFLPLDSTQLKLDEAKRKEFTTVSTPLTDALQVLAAEWMARAKYPTPTMFDAVAVGYAVDPTSCPMTPLHLSVDDKGMTLPGEGKPNASACLTPQPERFFNLMMPRLLKQTMVGSQVCLAKPAK